MLKELGVVGRNPEGWGSAPHHNIHKEGYGMLHEKKMELKGGLTGGKLELPRLDKAHVDKPHLQKPKRVY